MIVTLTPNPAVDRTVAIPALVRGEVLRASAPLIEASGKGVNVAKALLGNGRAAKAVLVADRQLAELLTEAAVPFEAIDGSVRTNVSLLEPDGTVTKVNEPGPELSEQDRRRLLEMTLKAGGDLVAASGSLPPGTNSAVIDVYTGAPLFYSTFASVIDNFAVPGIPTFGPSPEIVPTPEPSSIGLMATGGLFAFGYLRRLRNRSR